MRGDERERDELDMDFLKWKRGLLLLGVMRTIMMRAICRPFLFFFRGRWYVYSRGIFINSRLSTILLIFPILFRYVKRVSCKDLKIRME